MSSNEPGSSGAPPGATRDRQLVLYRDLFAATTPDSALAAGVSLAQVVMQSDMAWCGAAVIGGNELVMMAHVGIERHEMIHDWRVPVGSGLGGRAAQGGGIVQTRDYRRDPRRISGVKSVIDREGARGALVGALRGPSLPPASLYVADRVPRTFTSSEVEAFHQVCDDIAHAWSRALERAQLVQRLVEHADRIHDERQLLDGEAGCLEALNARDNISEALRIAASHLNAGLELVYRSGGPALITGPTTLPLQAEVPVRSSRGVLANILVRREAALSQRQERSLGRMAQAIALSIDRNSIEEDTARRLRGDLLDDLIQAVSKGGDLDEDLRGRCALLGFEVSEPHLIVEIGVRPTDGLSPPLSARDMDVLDELITRMFTDSHVFPHAGKAIALILAADLPENEEVCYSIEVALQQAEARLGGGVQMVAGIGAVSYSLMDYPVAIEEASLALDTAMRRAGARVCGLSAIDLHSVLGQLSTSRVLERVVSTLLDPLFDSDDNRSELIPTLRGYFRYSGSANRTAEALFLHPNTVRYRIKKALDLLGTDFEDGDRRFLVELAVRVHARASTPDGSVRSLLQP